jgi:predicted lipoprotein with Yx(FWY)xxD motif
MTLSYRRLVASILLLCPLTVLAQDSLPADIDVVPMGAGRLFVSQQGLTLYTYKRDSEQPGTSVCVDECATLWPPVIALEGAEAVGEWSVIRRQDGSQQWAYKGRPVYRYTKDTHPGAMIGEKASGTWDVLFEPESTPPGISIKGSLDGQILVDLRGNTVHTSDSDVCDKHCVKDWRPLEAPWMAAPIDANWSVTRRDDGLTQWTYKDQPLFTYAGDMTGVASGDRDVPGWPVVLLQEGPELPDWVTIQETDFGAVLADANRMTLYYLVSDPQQIERETCDAQCEEINWQPVTVLSGDKPVGNWSTTESVDGTRQWTYLGRPVFTYLHDELPGDINGDKFGAGSGVRGGWAAIVQGTLIQQLF